MLSGDRNHHGFTLLDSLIVIAILGIIGITIIPQFQGLVRETKLNEAATELVSGMQYAGNLAVRYGRPFGFQADATGRWFRIFDERYHTDPAPHTDQNPPVTAYGVVLNPLDKSWYLRNFAELESYREVTFTNAEVVFYPDGHSAATDTTVTVDLGADLRIITVDGATGRVHVQ